MSWPSVARCSPDEIPSDEWPCDHSNEMRRHRHDGTVGEDLEPLAAVAAIQIQVDQAAKIVMSWPSVARCSPDEIPSDEWACDHSNEMRRHRHDGTVGEDLEPAAATIV